MKRSIVYYLSGMLLSLILISCQERSKKSVEGVRHSEFSEIIKNPLTASNSKNEAKSAKISFTEESYFFGTVTEGDTVVHEYEFQNTGDQLLLITDARSSCGCTVPEYPEDPLKPGEKDKLRVVFDTKGKEGRQTKTITVYANTIPHTTKIKLVGTVMKENS